MNLWEFVVPEVCRSGHVCAGASDIWEAVADVAAMLEWYPKAKTAELIEGPKEGIGRVQRVRYKVGGRNATVDSEVIEWQPERTIAFRQVREFLGTKQAPLLARNMTMRVDIEPDGDGGCEIAVRSSWDPVGLKGELATDTVIRPKAETLVASVLDGMAADSDA